MTLLAMSAEGWERDRRLGRGILATVGAAAALGAVGLAGLATDSGLPFPELMRLLAEPDGSPAARLLWAEQMPRLLALAGAGALMGAMLLRNRMRATPSALAALLACLAGALTTNGLDLLVRVAG